MMKNTNDLNQSGLPEEYRTAYALYLSLRIEEIESRLRNKLIRAHFKEKKSSKQAIQTYLSGEEFNDAFRKEKEQSKTLNLLIREGKPVSYGDLSSREKEQFLQMRDMIRSDLACGRGGIRLSRYRPRMGITPFEREAAHKKRIEELLHRIPDNPVQVIADQWTDRFEADVQKLFETSDFMRPLRYSNYYKKEDPLSKYPPAFTKREMRELLHDLPESFFDMDLILPLAEGDFRFSLPAFLKEKTIEANESLSEILAGQPAFQEKFRTSCNNEANRIIHELTCRFPKDRIRECILKNAEYVRQLAKREQSAEKKEKEKALILKMIPEQYSDCFPAASVMRRKFILHVGPTNSGKTHTALEALKQASHGIYLAPLRLLAYEQYERLQSEHIPCSLVTGEEQILSENERVRSCTAEAADLHRTYDIAVIDEAQMIADSVRGGAWSAAVFGLAAETIHVCMSDQAEDLITFLIRKCGCAFEVHHYERLTPLYYEPEVFSFPIDVKKGDALIVFQRKNVHALANALKKTGISVSILYGNLPYDVRHREAQRFAAEQTSVLVSTDVIGMGMNLPIRRIIFMETAKFDGNFRRPLHSDEIKQIAGRAGRYLIYPEGRIASTEKRIIRNGLSAKEQSLTEAVIRFPEILIQAKGKLSKNMKLWAELPNEERLKKADLTEILYLTEKAETYTDDKQIVYQFAAMPFDSKNVRLFTIWNDLIKGAAENNVLSADLFYPEPASSFTQLEEDFKVLDLLYHYCLLYQPEACGEVTRRRRQISETLMKMLENAKFTPRRCRTCGQELPWNWPYGICENCWETRKYDTSYDLF